MEKMKSYLREKIERASEEELRMMVKYTSCVIRGDTRHN